MISLEKKGAGIRFQNSGNRRKDETANWLTGKIGHKAKVKGLGRKAKGEGDSQAQRVREFPYGLGWREWIISAQRPGGILYRQYCLGK
jgi:hypothetical protein